MANITLRAHFDGKQILLDEPFELSLNDKLLITVLTKEVDSSEPKDWIAIAKSSLSNAYSEYEPEYTTHMIKEPNPKYEVR